MVYLFRLLYQYNRRRIYEEDFKNLKLDEVITVVLRDAVKEGFLIEGVLEKEQADCVFLDLPNVHEAIQNAYDVLRIGGKICCFCISIEQVQKSCEELRKDGKFSNLLTKEYVTRPYSIRGVGKTQNEYISKEILCCPINTTKGHVGYVTFAMKVK